MQADSSSKCKGFHSKLTSWTTVAELCFVKDVLFPLKQFSLYCQEENSSVMECFARISTMINTISALGEGMGIALSQFHDAQSQHHESGFLFKEIAISCPTAAAKKAFDKFKMSTATQLKQLLEERLNSVMQIFEAATVLSTHYLPQNNPERILFGDTEILFLANLVKIPTENLNNLIEEYRMWKNGHPAIGELLKLKEQLHVLPISSAECERDFSPMNMIHNKSRNRMQDESRRILMFMSLNGPNMELLPAEQYAELWIKEGHHSATDKKTGKREKIDEKQHSLFI